MIRLINQLRALLIIVLSDLESDPIQTNRILIRSLIKLIRGKRLDATIFSKEKLREFNELANEYDNIFKEE
jgi:hypothetical protein